MHFSTEQHQQSAMFFTPPNIVPLAGSNGNNIVATVNGPDPPSTYKLDDSDFFDTAFLIF